MTSIRVGFVLALAVHVAGLDVAGPALAAGPEAGINVNVVNPPTSPVPVTGSIAVTGTSNVNVTNTSIPVTGTVNSSQSGAWNVGITGTPTVKVSNDQSLQTPYYSRRSGSACGSDDVFPC